MNQLLKYQLQRVQFNGTLDELQLATFLSFVNHTYDRFDEEREMYSKVLSASAKRRESLIEKIYSSKPQNESISASKYRRLLLNLAPFYFFYTKDNTGRFVYVSESVEGMLGFSGKEFIERYEFDLIKGLRCDIETRMLTTEYGYNLPFEVEVKDKEGKTRYLEITEVPIYDERGELSEVEGIVRDITEQYQVQNRISNMLYYDPLTGISNRLHLEIQMERLLKECRRKHGQFSILFIDLDYFKHINDTLGHDVGDELLKRVAESIRQMLDPGDIFARIGGDEFVIVLRETKEEYLLVRLRNIMKAFEQTWRVKEYDLQISASIGVARYPEDGDTIVSLMKNADIAMYRSKNNGRNNFTFFEPSFNQTVHMEMSLIQEMSDAIDRGEFSFHFQPKVSLKSNKVISAEALIRWDHPKIGTIYPDTFIDLAENTGLILKLGRWVINEACRSIEWFSTIMPEKRFPLSINISIRQFQQEDLYTIIKNALDKYHIDPSLLTIEITESIMMENNEEMIEKLNMIKSLNIGIALDDFGTGYSTLSYLDKISVNELKIDKAFIDAIPKSGEQNILLDTIITMGRTLHMTVVAEGVEHEYQRAYLRKKKCDLYQGFLFSRAVKKEEYISYFKFNNKEKKKVQKFKYKKVKSLS